MLLTKEQCQLFSKFLEPVGDEIYRYIGQNNASEDDKKKLLEFDELSFLCSGTHTIVNHNEIT